MLSMRFYPDAVISSMCDSVVEVNDEVRLFVDQMVETMYASSGVGLATPQVGMLKNIIVVDHS